MRPSSNPRIQDYRKFYTALSGSTDAISRSVGAPSHHLKCWYPRQPRMVHGFLTACCRHRHV